MCNRLLRFRRSNNAMVLVRKHQSKRTEDRHMRPTLSALPVRIKSLFAKLKATESISRSCASTFEEGVFGDRVSQLD